MKSVERSGVLEDLARRIAAVLALVLLLPFVLLALVPMLLMLVPVAFVGIPLIVPVMLSGLVANRIEAAAAGARRLAPTRLATRSASAAVRN